MLKLIPVTTLVLAACIAVPGIAEENYNAPPEPRNLSFESPSLTSGESDQEGVPKPEEWFWFSSIPEMGISVTDARRKQGLQSCAFKAQNQPEAYEGIAQRFAAIPGNHYTFVAYAMNDPQDPITGESYGQISLEWQDATGKEISRVYGPSWNFELPFNRWAKFIMAEAAPENASMGVVVITFFTRNCNGFGTFYIDDCGFSKRSGTLD